MNDKKQWSTQLDTWQKFGKHWVFFPHFLWGGIHKTKRGYQGITFHNTGDLYMGMEKRIKKTFYRRTLTEAQKEFMVRVEK